MIVVRSKQHRSTIEKSGHDRVHDRVGLSCPRRSLHIGQRILHRVVYRKKLIEIYLSVNQRQRILFFTQRTFEVLTEKRPNRCCDAIAVVHILYGAILMLQVQQIVHADSYHIGHVIHTRELRIIQRDIILDYLKVFLRLIQQIHVRRIKKLPDTELVPIDCELAAESDLLIYSHYPAFHIQKQLPIGKHI